MAPEHSKQKTGGKITDLPSCPVCMENMSIPVYQCRSGHSLCSTCTAMLTPPLCPLCRSEMTQMRNWSLEEVIAKAKVACPNKSGGCVYTMAATDVEEHLKECIFRQMDCPVGAVFGRCSWKGKLTNLMAHVKERHPAECNVGPENIIQIKGINVRTDDRYMYLVSQTKFIFIITFKIDTLQKMAYWTIQHIGSKKIARDHIYEIHLTSEKDPRRKVVFSEHCFNDALKADEVFRLAKCAMLPAEAMEHFIKDRILTFRFFIKHIPSAPNKLEGGKNENVPPKKWTKGPKGPGPGPSRKCN